MSLPQKGSVELPYTCTFTAGQRHQYRHGDRNLGQSGLLHPDWSGHWHGSRQLRHTDTNIDDHGVDVKTDPVYTR